MDIKEIIKYLKRYIDPSLKEHLKSSTYKTISQSKIEEIVGSLEGLLKEQSSEPLTMEELKQMDGKDVYCVDIYRGKYKPRWYVVDVKRFAVYRTEYDRWTFADYNKIWLAYRSKPKEA